MPGLFFGADFEQEAVGGAVGFAGEFAAHGFIGRARQFLGVDAVHEHAHGVTFALEGDRHGLRGGGLRVFFPEGHAVSPAARAE